MPTVTAGQWSHLAFVYSVTDDLKAIYHNGSLSASTNTSIDTLTSNRTAVRIGWPGDGTYYDGLMDDVRLYSRALNTTEIALLAGQSVYTLTVNSGTGDGDYPEDEVVDIAADAASSGQDFDEWVGDTSGIASLTSSSTTLTMPAGNQEITATYTDKTWTLTVNSGTGDGSYVVATVVDIDAEAAPSGQEFDEWIGDTEGMAGLTSASTTLTMPYADAQITATYTDKTWTLTVNSGTGDGSYVVGTIVDITADTAPSGQEFDDWIGDTAGIADLNDPTTTISMAYADAEITATYEDIPSTYTLTVNSGSGDGSYASSTVVDVDADTAPSGQQFDEWVGDTEGIASLTSASTTMTMPASNAEITATYTDITTGTIHFREGGGTGYTDVTFDDTYIKSYPATDDTYGNLSYDGIYARDDASYERVSLIAVKDMFTELPPTTGGKDIVITSAILYLYRYQGSSSTTVYVNRVTTDWLADPAGSNENDVSGEHAEKSQSTDWASGDFSTSDYDTSTTESQSWSDTYNGEVAIDVTDVIDDIYDAGNNYGMVVRSSGASIYARASEYGTSSYRPSLEIAYYYSE